MKTLLALSMLLLYSEHLINADLFRKSLLKDGNCLLYAVGHHSNGTTLAKDIFMDQVMIQATEANFKTIEETVTLRLKLPKNADYIITSRILSFHR